MYVYVVMLIHNHPLFENSCEVFSELSDAYNFAVEELKHYGNYWNISSKEAIKSLSTDSFIKKATLEDFTVTIKEKEVYFNCK